MTQSANASRPNWFDGFRPLDVETLNALPDEAKLEVYPMLVDAALASEAARFPPERDYYKAVQRWERLDLTVHSIRRWLETYLDGDPARWDPC